MAKQKAALLFIACALAAAVACTSASKNTVHASAAAASGSSQWELKDLAAGAASNNLLHRRALLDTNAMQAPPTELPKCYWEDDICNPSLKNWLQIPGMPSSAYRRAQLMGSQRAVACNAYKQEAACSKDTAQRCYWYESNDGKIAQCRSADFFEMLYYNDKNFMASVNTIPTAMTCPGTKAYEFYSCYAHPSAADVCESSPSCTLIRVNGKPICLPAWIDDYTQKQFDALVEGLATLDPKLYGSCAGACWINQAKECSKATKRAACEKLSFCSWDKSVDVCYHSVIEVESAYDKAIYQLYAMCIETDNQKDCEAGSLKGNTQQESASAALFRKYTPDSKPVNCPMS